MIKDTKQNWVVIPVYNDWKSLKILLSKLKESVSGMQSEHFDYLIVDDASTEQFESSDFSGTPFHLLKLRRNVGHQRAIATGLAYLNSLGTDINNLVIMDADGEDDPAAIPMMFQSAGSNPGKIVFSSRTERKEGFSFKIGYFFYKIIFRLLTGKKISFGNFSLVPGSVLPTVVNISEIWNHYSGGILKAGLKFMTIPVARNKRYTGKSTMGWVSLVLHGLRSIAVYLDRVAARLLLLFVIICGLLGLGIIVVLYFKFFTDFAIPGWATSAMSGLVILLFQALLISLFIVFIVLNQNTQRQIIPAIDFKDYIESVKNIQSENEN